MNRFVKRTAAMLIPAAAVLISLTSCTNPVVTPSPADSDAPPPSASVAAAGAIDHMFTIRYDADHTFNPITGTDPNNMALAPLMYESLFVLNDKQVPEPVLCDSCSTSDGITYTIKLKSDVAMSDGSTLTATDVKYSLSSAKQSGRYSGRLSIVDSISTVDSLTLKITLISANYMLPVLLDIPIIKANSGNQNHPAGTGPYTFTTTGEPHLTAFSEYRDSAKIPAPIIYLKSCTDAELSVEFSSQAVDMFWDDPADATDINILSDHEIRYYDTTILEFVGFNAKNKALANPDMRRALGLTIDRNKIIDTVYSNHGLAAPYILSPKSSLYDKKWEQKVSDPLGELSSIFNGIGPIGSDGKPLGLSDNDGNGYLEYPEDNGTWKQIDLTFIVNNDNKYKVQAAQEIASALKEVGINTTLHPLSWTDYIQALDKGEFDLYYGDISLPADYDPTAILSSGGSLDFGHVGNASYVSKINAYLAAAQDEARTAAAKELCDYVSTNAPIIPVLYRQYAVHTNRNIVTGLNPTQSSLFYGLTNWQINLG